MPFVLCFFHILRLQATRFPALWESFPLLSMLQVRRRIPAKQDITALLQHEPVECAQGQYFGVPVMNADTLGECQLGRRKAFHASSSLST